MNRAIIEKELTQGVVPIGTPKAYKYDQALVESAVANVTQGLKDLASFTEEKKSEYLNYANTILTAIQNQYGYPFTASTVSAMTDTSKIYVYTGSEEGYTAGNWYYNNGTAWVSGGVFNSIESTTKAEMSLFGIDDLLWDNTSPTSNSWQEVTKTVDTANKTVTLSGTSTGASVLNFYSDEIPVWLVAGKRYYAHCYTDQNIYFQVRQTVGGTTTTIAETRSVAEFVIDPNATAITIRLYIKTSGVSVSGVIRPFISETPTPKELTEYTKQEMSLFGVDDLLWDNAFPKNYSQGGVSYTVNHMDKSVLVDTNGNPSSGDSVLILSNTETIPSWLTKGKRYIAHIHSDAQIALQILYTVSGESGTTQLCKTFSCATFVIPDNATGINIRLFVSSGNTVTKVVRPFISECYSLGETENNIKNVTDLIDYNSTDKVTTVDLSDLTLYNQYGTILINSGRLYSDSNYRIYYYTATYPHEVFTDMTDESFLEVVVFENALLTSGIINGGSSTSNNLPTAENRFPVSVGNVVAMVVRYNDADTNAFKIVTKEFSGGLEQIVLTKTAIDSFNIKVPSLDGSKFCRYDFTKAYKEWATLNYVDGDGVTQTAQDVLSCDYWNNYYVYDNNGNRIAQGHSNFIVKVAGENVHVGDGHGNEVTKRLQIIADGEIVDIDSMVVGTSVNCDNLRFFYVGDMYASGNTSQETTPNTEESNYPKLDTSGNPIVNFEHYMDISYEVGNVVTINNKLIVKQDNISFTQCHGAMLQCWFGEFDYVKLNNTEETINAVGNTGTVSVVSPSTIDISSDVVQIANKGEMYGKQFYIQQKMTKVQPTSGIEPRIHCTFYTNRLKLYFEPVLTDNNKLSGETPETFNTGDVIAVEDKRTIAIK